ncbi:MAG: hypothetical protein ACE5H1_12480, partial [Thermodesulfobacteriota bacterium]
RVAEEDPASKCPVFSYCALVVYKKWAYILSGSKGGTSSFSKMYFTSIVEAYNMWLNSSKWQHVPPALQLGLILASSASSSLYIPTISGLFSG